MNKEQKELLLQDLCARLSHSVKVQCLSYQNPLKVLSINPNGETWVIGDKGYPFEVDWKDCKPYLFPMSSMTKKQKKDLLLTTVTKKGLKLFSVTEDGIVSNDKEEQSFANFSINWINFSNKNIKAYIGWLNKNHFDIYGLIPMGLAVDATGLNIYHDKK